MSSDLFVKTGAVISECGSYRYSLSRLWDEDKATMIFIMQNPSVANTEQDDPTIRKCIGFARKHGYGSIVVRNVFALRATDERELLTHPDPVGPLNYEYLVSARNTSILTRLVVAWGNRLGPKKRSLFRTAYCNAASACVQQSPYCLGTTKSGDPKHPLFLPYETEFVKWVQPAY